MREDHVDKVECQVFVDNTRGETNETILVFVRLKAWARGMRVLSRWSGCLSSQLGLMLQRNPAINHSTWGLTGRFGHQLY